MNTLVEMLERAAGSREGIDFYDLKANQQHYSYTDIHARSKQVAYHLSGLGIKKGDVVALCLVTGPFFLDAFFGVLMAGGIPVCSYPPMKLGDLSAWAERTAQSWQQVGAKLIITDDILEGLVAHACVIANPSYGLRSEKHFKAPALSLNLPVTTKNDLAFLQFSSGTTGRQKAVALTHEAVLKNIEMITQALPEGEHSCVSWLPLYHDMGLVGALLSSLYLARPIALMRPDHFLARPRLWLEVLTHTKATISVAPNFAYGLCAKKIKSLDGLDLSNWKVALCGAETVHAKTLSDFADHFASIGLRAEALTPVYGMAEVGLAATFSSLSEKPKWQRFESEALTRGRALASDDDSVSSVSLCSVGKPLQGTTLEVRSGERVCAEGVIGEIYLSSASLMREYYNDPKITAETLSTGKLRTGDRGFLYEGELYLFGRTKEVIIIKGRNIDPSHLEISLHAVGALRTGRVAACSFTDAASAEEGFYLFAEVQNKQMLAQAQQIKAEVEAALVRVAGVRPFEVILLEPGVLPRTSSGKIQRSKVIDLWRSGELQNGPRSSGNLLQYGVLSLSGKLRYLGGRLLNARS